MESHKLVLVFLGRPCVNDWRVTVGTIVGVILTTWLIQNEPGECITDDRPESHIFEYIEYNAYK